MTFCERILLITTGILTNWHYAFLLRCQRLKAIAPRLSMMLIRSLGPYIKPSGFICQHCASLLSSDFARLASLQIPYLRLSTSCSTRRAAGSQPETVMNVFNREAKRIQRDRAAAAPDSHVYDYLRKEIGFRVADRVKDISRKFENALEIGSGKGFVAQHLNAEMIGTLQVTDISQECLNRVPPHPDLSMKKFIMDEEQPLPFDPNSLDLVYSSLNLHWVNNLPGLFRNILDVLKPDACFIGSMFGGETLFELRCSLQLAETEREGGFAPHISPFTSNRDVGNLLGRAGFNLLTIDVDEIVVSYPSIFELMYDIKGMGENSAAWTRKMLHRDTLLAAASIYKELYGNENGTVPATFQIIYMIGWKPHPSQAKPAERGSANFSLKDIDKLGLKTRKIGTVKTEESSES